MMSPAITREQRRQLERDNAKQPVVLTVVPREQWPSNLSDPSRLRVWRSRFYLVQEFSATAPAIVRLSVNRTKVSGNRWYDGLSWDELQQIKAECGYEHQTAVEVYPPAADVVNVANMRHLWVLDEPPSFAWKRGKQ